MTQRLTEMKLTRVSLVDKGANATRLAVFKRHEEGLMTEAADAADQTPTGIATWLRKAADLILGKSVEVAKTATFAEVVAGQELRDALYDSWYTLEDVIWGAIYATDENGVELSMEAKTALVAQDLDEFKAYLIAQMASGVSKRADPASAPQRHLAAIVEKAGKKISGDRMARLQSAAEALNGVLAEVAEIKEEEAESAEEEQVEKAELVAAFTEANAPLVERIDKIEKSMAATVEKTDDEDAPVTLEGIATAIEKLADRVEAVEKTRGSRTSADGQEGAEPVRKRGTFAGILD